MESVADEGLTQGGSAPKAIVFDAGLLACPLRLGDSTGLPPLPPVPDDVLLDPATPPGELRDGPKLDDTPVCPVPAVAPSEAVFPAVVGRGAVMVSGGSGVGDRVGLASLRLTHPTFLPGRRSAVMVSGGSGVGDRVG